jgi:DNA polymerase-3 subunit delta'
MGFDNFIGNRKIIERVRTKLREGRFPHGLIFAGPEGVGKHTCALMIAKALNCTARGPADFCDTCSSCRKIHANTHPDVLVIGVEEEASQIRIAQIRQALRTLDFQPMEGANKVFIIDPANLMNLESANALLKGLEEPPDNSFFILIAANIQELLLTVRSRCQVYHFPPLTTEEIRRHGIEDQLIIRWSQGSIGKARSLNPERLKARRDELLAFLETAAGAADQDFRDLLAAGADISRSKQDFGNDMTVLSVLHLLFISEGMCEKVVNLDIEIRLKKLSFVLTSERLIQMAGFLRVIETSVKSNVNRQILLDVFALMASES